MPTKLSEIGSGSAQIGAAEPVPGPIPGATFRSAARVGTGNNDSVVFGIPSFDVAVRVGTPVNLFVVGREADTPGVNPFASLINEEVRNQQEVTLPLTAESAGTDVTVEIENDLDESGGEYWYAAVIEYDAPAA